MLLDTLFIAFAWVLFTGEPTLVNFGFGAMIGFLSMRLVSTDRTLSWRFVKKTPQFIGLALYFFWELVVANLKIARAVLGDPSKLQPAIIAVHLDVDDADEIVTLANLITLTPGTLSLDVSTDRKTLYVHCADCPDPEAMRQEIKAGFEKRVLGVFA
ncbi:Na+/H+ antiporter subunit E [Engelhardtia mirabilis]|uniref:Na(+)/H(+) antiporter subunit E n=1 Tax=Engelhardtia mirabilis TaxID=2528011 RepID=A0A518BF14_9BACT|nr:Na(+)/H(+) antiporter subunit E [Planctomycetes bacterium Pla133]QDU99905.1 Na(+)/H(+) antiporter subunit E [Planctomycetes bacterium Pla86]